MKVLVAQKISQPAMDLLYQSGADVTVAPEGDAEAFKELLKSTEAVVLGTWIKFTAEMMDSAPGLKVISRTGMGVDNVDVKAATERKILVLNTPKANAVSVAEHATSMIGAISKQFIFLDSAVREGNFKARRMNLPVDIDGKTLGLIGCGNIGRQVAAKCAAAYNMAVIGYDAYIPGDLPGIKMMKSIEEVFVNADYISIHVPLTDETRGLVNAELIAKMKPTSYIVNTSRGGIVDEDALVDAIRNGKLAGAALDVFSSEPPAADSELLKERKILLTPHSAALTKECTVRVACAAVTGVIDYMNGKTPEFVFNKELVK